ncbi:abhydrolase domain-containing 12 [Auriscalpium vulgare]|uniref:Abhydrolase domain-containing 12 n=1 Tax=Auriscalpium vulgare TaxID=40419 RepID=A0ACB8R3U5_9AGAM|nr:abhydrolase domain-containing 12 [Auriscalpium vulgare]
MTFIAKARVFSVSFGAFYALILVLLCFWPAAQRQVLYMHAVRLPLGAQFDLPERYGLAPHKTLNIGIRTPDNETIGAWFTLSEPFYAAQKTHKAMDDETIKAALRAHPTLLYFHGTAATRALNKRVAYYKEYSARLRMNVLAIDYRGFADSTGVPTEEGLTIDARAAWDWLAGHGAQQGDVLIMGNSLGTAVSVQLASALENDGIRPRGVVLLAPFTRVEDLLESYHLFSVIPLLAPLKMLPQAAAYLKTRLTHRFDTLAKITTLKTGVLLAHAADDFDISHSHSDVIFEAFLEKHLPTLPLLTTGLDVPSEAALQELAKVVKERATVRSRLVTSQEVDRVGLLEVFKQSGGTGDVVILKTEYGGHDQIGLWQGVQDIVAELFDLH